MTTTVTTQQANKDAVRALFDAYANSDAQALRNLLSSGFTAHTMPPRVPGDASGFEQVMHTMHAALSDCRYVIEDIVAADDAVVVRYTTRARFTGELFGAPPTGEEVSMTGIEWYRFGDGKATDYWAQSSMDLGADG